MPNKTLTYLHLPPEGRLPALDELPPFLAILIIEDADEDGIDDLWQADLCRHLVASGCHYLLAWGRDCEVWREAFEDAAQEAADYEDVPPERAVLATAHEDEDLDEVFWFARHRAVHPALPLDAVVIVHVAPRADADRLTAAYEAA